MLLAIDIGNTNITLGVFKIKSGRALKGPAKIWRLATDPNSTSDEYALRILDLLRYSLIEYKNIKAAAIASVVPYLNDPFEEVSNKYFGKKPFFVEAINQKYLKISYDNPKEIGADRIADAVAAYEFFGGPIIVVDFGTATTFDCISKNREYLGGAIVPGILVSAESLARKTAKLPLVEIKKTKNIIGKSTISGIQSGIYYGYVGLVEAIIAKISKEMPKPKVIATGGLAPLITSDIKEVKAIIPELTLEGIRIIWNMQN
ncbi:MAG: type III pantothenate kinase [Elusimicrobia bacterium]|nr:type III pantothenate kinase [Candidatus Liberimonas magnetica]